MITKKLVTALVGAVLCAALLGGCGGGAAAPSPSAAPSSPPASTTPSEPSVPSAATTPVGDPAEQDAVLCAVFGDPDSVERYAYSYSGDLTPQVLMDALTELTGLDFEGTADTYPAGIYVAWGDFSTLITGMDGREQKDEFYMYDTESLRWFMMDSLWYTLRENLGEINVFYSREGQSEMSFDDEGPSLTLNLDTPYLGSNFYMAHMDGQGDS